MSDADDLRVSHYPRTGEIDIAGGRAALKALAALIASGSGTVLGSDGAAEDDLVRLPRIQISTSEQGHLMIDVDIAARSLLLSGDLPSLRMLAGDVDGIADVVGGGHAHIEHYPDHPYIAEGALPLIVNSPDGGMPT
jgi:hypothetical protein